MLGRAGIWKQIITDAVAVVGNKNVRSTRFAIIGSGTSGTVTLPPNSTVILDDFGGTVDAVVTQVSGSKPTQIPALTSAGAVVATTFDASGNWVFSGTPVSYPVAIVYRVSQTLTNFDSTASDIWGGSEFHEILPTANGGTGNGNNYSQYGVIYASSSTQLSQVFAGSSGLVLLTQGSSAPRFGAVNLAGAGVTGVLPIANGGIGQSTFNAAGIWVNGSNAFGVNSFLGTSDNNNLNFVTNNVNRMTVASSGFVGIGTTAPLSKLHLSGSPLRVTNTGDARLTLDDGTQAWSFSAGQGTDGDFNVVQEGVSGDRFYIKNNGAIGIGTTSPLSKLEVNTGANRNINLWATGNYNAISLNGGITSGSTTGIVGGATGDDSLYVGAGGLGDLIFRTLGTTERMRILTGGNVGIGTAAPGVPLHVVGSALVTVNMQAAKFLAGNGTAAATSISFVNATNTGFFSPSGSDNIGFSTGGVERMRVSSAGNVGIGTPSPATKLEVNAASGAVVRTASFLNSSMTDGQINYINIGNADVANNGFVMTYTHNSNAASRIFAIEAFETSIGSQLTLAANGNVGIGLANPDVQFRTTGAVRFSNFGAGAATFDANGNISSVSDEELKDIQGPHSVGLAALMNVNPIEYKWKEETGFDTENIYIGFSAQNIEQSLGSRAVGKAKTIFKDRDVAHIPIDGLDTPIEDPIEEPREYRSIQDRAIMAAMINAIKELNNRVENLEQ